MEKSLIPTRASIATIQEEEDFFLRNEVLAVIPVVRNYWGHALHVFLSVITLGLFALSFIWRKKLWIKTRFRRTSIELATHIIVITDHNEEQLLKKRTEFDENGNLRIVVIYRYLKYIFDRGEWIAQRNCLRLLHTEIHAMVHGIREDNQELLRAVFGVNSTRIRVDPISKIFTEEALTSFNIYQLFGCVVWWFRNYQLYSGIIFVFVIASIVFEVILIRSEQRKINQMAVSTTVRVFRKKFDKAMRTVVYTDRLVDSTELVPGDIIEVSPDEKVPCDLIVLDGQCLVDESLLTGESQPMLKMPLPPNDMIFNEANKENIVFAGTSCITSTSSKSKDEPARAMVYQIGFGTTKGRLIRSIMFNNPKPYRFERDSNYFTLYLFSIALVFVAVYYYITFVDYDTSSEGFL